jgi:hypothetical protein
VKAFTSALAVAALGIAFVLPVGAQTNSTISGKLVDLVTYVTGDHKMGAMKSGDAMAGGDHAMASGDHAMAMAGAIMQWRAMTMRWRWRLHRVRLSVSYRLRGKSSW